MAYEKLSMVPNSGQDDADEFASSSEKAYSLIRRDILDIVHAPGSKLKIIPLKARYGLGQTPIREALSRLSSEGLLRLEQQRGFRVAPVTFKELRELSQMRVLLEVEALRLALVRGDVDWEAAIVSAFYKLERLELAAADGKAPDPQEWEHRNREFHDSLVAAADHDTLLRLRAQLYDLHGRYRRLARLGYDGTRRAVHVEHRQLMEAALARDVGSISTIIAHHIHSTVEAIQQTGIFEPRPISRS